jgi:hypothetical protein
MSEIEKTSVPAFLSTHPSNKNRFKVGPFCKAFLHHTDTISIADGRVAARGTQRASGEDVSDLTLTSLQARSIRAASNCGETSAQYTGFLDTLSAPTSIWR